MVESLVMSQNEDKLFAVLQSVYDEESFLEFLLALRDDREASVAQEKLTPSSPYGPEAGDRENTTIERFFNAAVAWARDSKHGMPLVNYVPPSNPWRRCADILYAAIVYE